MSLGTLSRIWRYPVKSMTGEVLESTSLGPRGIPGDRGWALFDTTRAGVSNAKRMPAVRRCVASYASPPGPDGVPPPARVTLPDGATFLSSDPDAAERMTGFVGRPVEFRRIGPAGSAAAPRVNSQEDSAEALRALNGLQPGEPEPDYSAFPPERVRALRQDNFFDALPIHLITRTTLRTLAALAPESDWDERRFRANLVVDAEETEGYPEQKWLGRRARIGEAILELSDACPRCVMVTLAVDELPQDHRIMRTLVRETRHTAGIYASVLQPGRVAPGDRLELS